MTAAILITSYSDALAGADHIPPEGCTGHDGAFAFDIPGIYDWWVARELGCDNPGYSWTVMSCDTGQVLDVVIEGFLSSKSKVDLTSDLNLLRDEYANLDAPPKLTKIISDLEAIGAEPIVRSEPIDPGKYCKTGTVSDEGEAKQ